MAINHLSRIVNMLSRRELDTIKKDLEIGTLSDITDDINNVVESIENESNFKEDILNKYKYVFKPHSSHIYTYSDLSVESIQHISFGGWTKVYDEIRDGVHYYCIEKDYTTKKINAGWEFTNVNVKQVGIVVIRPEINVLEIRSNLVVKNQLEKIFDAQFQQMSSLIIDRTYYTAILEELNAKEFSIIWETEGVDVRKAQLEGNNISVKNGAVIIIKDENGELVSVDLGTEGNPEAVWSVLSDYDAKILLSSKGNLRISKLISEKEVNSIVLKIISAVKNLPISQNIRLDKQNTESFKDLFVEFCDGIHKNILLRFSKRYFNFRASLSLEDTEIVLNSLCGRGFLSVKHELYCEEGHFWGFVEEIDDSEDLFCEMCSSTTNYDLNLIKKVYSVTEAGFLYLEQMGIMVISGNQEDVSIGMNNAVFNDDPINPEELHWQQSANLIVKEQLLRNAIEKGNQDEIKQIVQELLKMNCQEAMDIIEDYGIKPMII